MNTIEKHALDGSPSKEKETDNKDFGNELIQREKVEDSPFMVVTVGEESFGIMGAYRITEGKKSKEEVIKELRKITWNRLMQVICIIMEIQLPKD